MMKAGWSGRRCTCFPVYIFVLLSSRRQFENLAHLRRAVDLARVARHPWRRHCSQRDAVEMLRPYLHLTQAARHAEAADEIVKHVAGILARVSHRGGDQRLALGINRL